MSARRPRYHDHDGYRMPAGLDPAALPSGLGYRAQPGDLFVVTYPKCGTTWMQHVLWQLAHGGQPLGPEQELTHVFPHLEEMGREHVEALPRPRRIKTHLPFEMTPHHAEAKYIHVVRNPFDCVVSFFHHTRGFVKLYDYAEGTLDDFVELFIAGEVDFGDYFDHLLSWSRRWSEDNVSWLRFEDMKADLGQAISMLGAFLGEPFESAAQDPEIRRLILHHSDVSQMRKHQRRWASERPEGMPGFIRKGQVGGWREELGAAQARRLADHFCARVEGTELESLWPEMLSQARGS